MAYGSRPHHLARNASRGILALNHENTTPAMMFREYMPGSPTQEQVDVEVAAHGVSSVEVVRLPLGEWRYRVATDFNRRITGETSIEIAGPVAGRDWLKVAYEILCGDSDSAEEGVSFAGFEGPVLLRPASGAGLYAGQGVEYLARWHNPPETQPDRSGENP